MVKKNKTEAGVKQSYENRSLQSKFLVTGFEDIDKKEPGSIRATPRPPATRPPATTTPATTTPATPPPVSISQRTRYTQIKRLTRLREFCKNKAKSAATKITNSGKAKQNERLAKQKDMHFMYSDEASVIYCYIPKVACTNWKRIFQVFYGNVKHPLEIKGKEKVHVLDYKSFAELPLDEITWRQSSYYSFLFVRHPFERVLSAFRNKLQDPYNTQYQLRYGARILRMFRTNLTEAEYKSGKNVTFSEFVEYIIRTHEKHGYPGLNEHWTSMNELCHPCIMKYDHIGEMDSLVHDSQTILEEIGWSDRVEFPVKAKDKYKKKLTALVQQYYLQVPKASVENLYKIFEDDFKAFGYVIDGYV